VDVLGVAVEAASLFLSPLPLSVLALVAFSDSRAFFLASEG
jgi:hypothetical protein